MSFYNQMVTFIAVVEEQGFTRAANKLSITTTAVSKQIKQLEARLGQQLLDRDTRTVRVTDIGERFYLHCKRIANEVSAAEDFIQVQQDEPQGKLRVLCFASFAQSFLVQRLKEFHERYPKIELDITIDDRNPDLDRENFDIVIGCSSLPSMDSNHIRYRKVLSSYYILCASPSYLEKYGVPQIPEDLKNHKLLNHPLRQPENVVRFRDGKEVYMDTPKIVINNMPSLLKLCADGMGILHVTEYLAREYFQQKILTHVLPDYPLPTRDVILYYRALEYEQLKVRCFIDFFMDKCQKSMCSISILKNIAAAS